MSKKSNKHKRRNRKSQHHATVISTGKHRVHQSEALNHAMNACFTLLVLATFAFSLIIITPVAAPAPTPEPVPTQAVSPVPEATSTISPSCKDFTISSNFVSRLYPTYNSMEEMSTRIVEMFSQGSYSSDLDLTHEEKTDKEGFQFSDELPQVVYLHFNEPTGNLRDVSWAPEVLFEPVSQDDIPVDLSDAMQSEPPLELSDYWKQCLYITNTRETRGEPFLGKLFGGEDPVNRIRSGVYGDNIEAILAKGYLVEFDPNGDFHVYDGKGKEILEPNEDCKRAVDIALAGSNVTRKILEAVTAAVNERYGLDLGAEYYEHGAFYHFNPADLSDKAMKKRRFEKAPVMFQFKNHTFQGCWLPSSAALDVHIEY